MNTTDWGAIEPDDAFPEPDEEVIDWDEDAYWDTVADR